MTSAAADLRTLLDGARLPALDGCRALAVASVVASHASLLALGDLGVSLFFVLSGFLITWLLLKEREANGTISLGRFYARRTLRIFPAYYAFLAVNITWDLMRGDDRIFPAIVPGLLYVMNYFNALNGHPSISIAHSWSLAVEEQFYLLWPLALLWLARGGADRVARGLLVAIGLVVVWRSLAFALLDLGVPYVYNAFDTRFDALAVGCLLAVVARADWFVAGARRLASSSALPLLTLALLLTSRLAGGESYRHTVGFTLEALLLGLFLVQVLLLSGTRAWGWLEWRAVRFVGTLSYPIYLYHILGLGAGRRLSDSAPLAFALGCVATLGLATASYYVIERPFLAMKPRFASAALRRATLAGAT